MAVTNYITMNGRLMGEQTGGVRTDYLTDALGSVTATVDQTGNVMNTYRYKPYGATLAKTGSAADPAFGWVGSYGYRRTTLKYNDVYVRARHYASALGRWTTSDPIGTVDSLNTYQYAYQNPQAFVDPSGLSCCCCTPTNITVTPKALLSETFYPFPSLPILQLRIQLTWEISIEWSKATGDSGGMCSLQYWEKVNYGGNRQTGGAPGSWRNDADQGANATLADWNAVTPPNSCPAAQTVKAVDTPNFIIPIPPNKTPSPVVGGGSTGILCIMVKVSSGSGCPALTLTKSICVVWASKIRQAQPIQPMEKRSYCVSSPPPPGVTFT